jgi:catechol 2,3-dioxygenase-like lactoylglutathione lyase family enzyme
MFTHIMVGSSDVERSRSFYDATMQAIGHAAAKQPEGSPRLFYGGFATGAFAVGLPGNGEAHSWSNGGMTSFRAADPAAVDAWHAAGLGAGGTCEGAPGPRQEGASYGAYLRDPDGNKLAAFSAPAK